MLIAHHLERAVTQEEGVGKEVQKLYKLLKNDYRIWKYEKWSA